MHAGGMASSACITNYYRYTGEMNDWFDYFLNPKAGRKPTLELAGFVMLGPRC